MTTKKGVSVAFFKEKDQGLLFAKETLYKKSTPQTLLLLSGGNTPKPLYQQLTAEKKLSYGSITLVDERYGEPFHEGSNALLLRQCGFKDFFAILRKNKSLEETTELFNRKLHALFIYHRHRVAVMGVGEDGHTAGLPAGISNISRQAAGQIKNEKLVEAFDDFPGPFRQRITLTFKALEMVGLLILLVFGEEKKEALEKMFTTGLEEEIPARFYTRAGVAEKTLLITDQRV